MSACYLDFPSCCPLPVCGNLTVLKLNDCVRVLDLSRTEFLVNSWMQFLSTYLSANTGSFVSSPPHSEHFLLTHKQQLPTTITIVTWGGEYFCTNKQKFIRVCLLASYTPFTGCFLPHTIFLPRTIFPPHTIFLWSKVWGAPFFQRLPSSGHPLCNYQSNTCLG